MTLRPGRTPFVRANFCTVAALSLGALLLPGGGGCVFVVSPDEAQCDVDDDCLKLGSSFEGTTCGPRKTCIALESYCFKNQDCIDRAGGETAFCRKADDGKSNRCVSLVTEECNRILADPGDLANDEAVIVGDVWARSLNPILAAAENGFEMARREFKGALQGLPPRPGSGTTRPLVIVSCDIPVTALQNHTKATDHLINNVGVPVILGPLTSEWISYAINQGEQNNVLTLSPDPTYLPLISASSTLYLTNGTPALTEAQMAGLLMPLQERRVRATLPEAEKARDLKVVMMQPGLGNTTEFSRGVLQLLSFNGRPALEQNMVNYFEIAYGDAAQAQSANSTFAQAMAQVGQIKPDIIVLFNAGSELVVNTLEASGLAPHYILPAEASAPSIAELMGNDEAKRRRVVGYRAGRPFTTDFKAVTWQGRYVGAFGVEAMTTAPPHPLATLTYDLTYMFAYAVGALGDRPITGQNLAEVMRGRFQAGGVPASTDPDSIKASLQALAAGQNLNLDGTLQPGVFSGNSVSKYYVSTYCVSPNRMVPFRFPDAGVTWESGTTALQGNFSGDCAFLNE